MTIMTIIWVRVGESFRDRSRDRIIFRARIRIRFKTRNRDLEL